MERIEAHHIRTSEVILYLVTVARVGHLTGGSAGGAANFWETTHDDRLTILTTRVTTTVGRLMRHEASTNNQ